MSSPARSAVATNGRAAATTNATRAALNGVAALSSTAATPTNGVASSNKITTNGHHSQSCSNSCNKPSQTAEAVPEGNTPKGKHPELAAKIIKQSHIVCFDVDSTVIAEEGIDELAAFCGKGDEVARVTKEAMGGMMTFQDALSIRLNIIRPTQKQIDDFLKLRPSTLTPNVKQFIAHLRASGKQVYLISGGFDCLIEPVAQELGVPLEQLYANKLLFYKNGDYAGFDTSQPTSRSGGKAQAIALIRQQHVSDALITMIGDGATDMEAVPPADHFIGFGGHVQRAAVFAGAQFYITDFAQLM